LLGAADGRYSMRAVGIRSHFQGVITRVTTFLSMAAGARIAPPKMARHGVEYSGMKMGCSASHGRAFVSAHLSGTSLAERWTTSPLMGEAAARAAHEASSTARADRHEFEAARLKQMTISATSVLRRSEP